MQTTDSVTGLRIIEADVADYVSFKRRFGMNRDSKRCLVGKYYLIQRLVEQGCNSMYIDATYRFGRPWRTVKVDVFGQSNGEILLGLCSDKTATERDQLYRKLVVLSSTPAKVMLTLPLAEPLEELRKRFHQEFLTGKFEMNFIPKEDTEEMGDIFREALDMASLLANRTRIQMLLPLLIEPASKSHYRVRINPKLVYENLSILTARGLVREMTENRYSLTHVGNRVLAEYLAFLQKMRETLESEQWEVKTRNELG